MNTPLLSLFRPCALALLLAAGTSATRAALITGDSFDTYSDGRLSTVSSSAWTSTSQTLVASGSGIAFNGAKYVEISPASITNHTASRTFTGLPASGVYYVQFSLQSLFSSADIGSSNQPQLRLGDGTNNLITVLYRNTSNNITINYTPVAGGPATSIETSITYNTSAWNTFTYAIDVTNQTASIYVNGTSIVSSFSYSGYGTLGTIDFRAALPNPGTAFRLDAIGFYDAAPSSIPEPAATAALAGITLLGIAAGVRRLG